MRAAGVTGGRGGRRSGSRWTGGSVAVVLAGWKPVSLAAADDQARQEAPVSLH